MQHISYPSTKQFRDVIRQIKDTAKYHGEGLPTLRFTGTIKLHGTNHSVCFAPSGEMYTQSRERITAIGDDNAGSSAWSHANKALFARLVCRVYDKYTVSTEDTVQIFGEWCGGNIQKSVGLNKLPKMFVVFGIRVSKDSDSQEFLPQEAVQSVCDQICTTIYDFPIYKLDIDFNFPERSQEVLIALTTQVEKDCPVARQLLGQDFPEELIGEGIVWSTVYKGITIRFKVKGEKHSSSKVKVLAPVDVEKMESIREFVASVVTESRLTQGLEHVESREAKHTGAFIKWVMGDIFKEEMDTMLASGFTNKDVTSTAAASIRKWFLEVQ